MRRREFISLLGSTAVAWPIAAQAQGPAKPHIGIPTTQPRTSLIYAAFVERLRELGYTEDQIDFVNPEQQPEGVAGAVKNCTAGRSTSSSRLTRVH
jgi:hypothetical protein